MREKEERRREGRWKEEGWIGNNTLGFGILDACDKRAAFSLSSLSPSLSFAYYTLPLFSSSPTHSFLLFIAALPPPPLPFSSLLFSSASSFTTHTHTHTQRLTQTVSKLLPTQLTCHSPLGAMSSANDGASATSAMTLKASTSTTKRLS